MSWRFGIFWVALTSISIPATSLAQLTVPDVPKEIAVPPNHKPRFKLEARGVQIYKAVVGKSGTLEWEHVAPLAELFDGEKKCGFHYDNPPSWEAADGSKVVKSGDPKMARPRNPEKDIPLLLVPVTAQEGKEGKLSPVVYIQRLETKGGKPPKELPKRVGTKVGVAYEAVYYFYVKVN